MPFLSKTLYPLVAARRYLRLPMAAKFANREDRRGLPTEDPGIERTVAEAIAWLSRAQDNSLSHDGGVSRDYDLEAGWAASYPETTGYIVPTVLEYARRTNNEALR